MAQLHSRFMPMRFASPVLARTAIVLCVAALTGACGERRDERAVQIDSALDRDLTLAASATPNVSIGDTAISSPAGPAPAPAPAEAPGAAPAETPETRRSPLPTPVRPPVRRAPTSAASSLPRSVPRTAAPAASSEPEPAPGAPSAAAPVAVAPAPATAASESAAAAGRTRAIGAGTVLTGPTNAQICSLAQRPGDRFVVSLSREVTGPDGTTLAPGTPVLVELARVDTTTGEFAFRLRGVQVNGEFVPAEGTVRVADATVTERKVSKGGSDQGKVITGAIIGGILGRVIGGGARGAVIGAAGGAAAGTVAAARNQITERCLSAGATLSATLSAPLVLP